jgi:hypothetical protein
MNTRANSSKRVDVLLAELGHDPLFIDPDLLRRIRSRREETVPRLLALVEDLASREEPPDPFRAQGLLAIHAAVLLADLGVKEMVPILLPFFLTTKREEYQAYLEQPLHAFGNEVLPRLSEVVRDRAVELRVRALAAASAAELALAYPDRRAEVLPLLRLLLAELVPPQEGELTYAVQTANRLGMLEDRESMPLIRELRDRMPPWLRKKVDPWLAGHPYPQLHPRLRPRPFRGAWGYFKEAVEETWENGWLDPEDLPPAYQYLCPDL